MENTIILNSGAKLDVVMQDNVTLDIDCALRYIKSGHQEIADYVNTQAKPHLQEVITLAQTQMNNAISQGVTDAAQAAEEMTVRTIEASISTAEDAISAYVTSDITPSLNSLLTQATAAANTATQTVSGFEAVCEAKISDFNANATTKQNAVNVAAQNAENSAITANSAATSAQNSAASASQSAALIDSVIANAKDEISAELNNPFSLLDCKYSEYELSNASWLLSNGQWNSGEVYQSVYDLLLQIYNGTTTKAGVSVKLSTDTYADTDFVINTTDTTFRLPLKVALASGNKVAGNGMTLGFTNGTQNLGFQNPQGDINLGLATDMYGTNVGTPFSRNYGTANVTIGLTTDPLKSGIETSANGLYLYFYVGETVQDANIIAAAGVLNDMTNIKNGVGYTNTGKENIVGWGMPDYSAGISGTFSSSYTAPANGLFVYFVAGLGQGGERELYVNNARVGYLYNSSSNLGTTIRIIVSKGDIVTCSIYTGASYNFYPMKGAN